MAVRTYITETEFAKIDNPQSATTYIVLDDNDLTLVKKVVFKTNNINKEGEIYIVQDEFPTPSGAIDITANANNIDVKRYATANVNVQAPVKTCSFKFNSDGQFQFNKSGLGSYYLKVNDGQWVEYDAPATIDVYTNDVIELKSDVIQYLSTAAFTFNDNPNLTTAVSWELEGDLLGTLYGDKFPIRGCYQMFKGCKGLTKVPNDMFDNYEYTPDRGCEEMFSGCRSLTTAPALPATTLASYCYNKMFTVCTSLTTAPALPATTLAQSCYNSMFSGCTSLTTAPALPATTLASNCYYSMFRDCTSLTTAPELPATTLAAYCYAEMFNGCTSLNYIKCLATNIAGTSNWVSGVAATGTFVKDANTTWSRGTSGIPSGWTVEDAA